MAIQATKQIVGFRQGRINARKYAKQQARLRDNLARGFQRKIETSFNKNVNIISRTITEDAMMSSGNVVALIDDELEKVIKAQLKRVFKAVYDYNDHAYNKITQKQEEPFDFGRSIEFEEVVAQYFSSREPLFANISRNQGILILREVERLRLEDLSVDQIGRELRKKFRRINRNRSALIARTETHSATGFAHHNYHKNVSDSYGVSMIKEWVATNDGRTRPTHAEVSGTKISMDESFKVGGREMDFVGDPKGGPANVINCRCVIVYADAEDDVTQGRVSQEDIDTDFDPNEKPYIDGIEVVSIKSGKKWQKELNENLSPLLAKVANALRRPERIQKGRGSFTPYAAGIIRTPVGLDNKFGKTIKKDGTFGKEIKSKNLVLSHEYGHHVDYSLGYKLEGTGDVIISKKIFENSVNQTRDEYKFFYLAGQRNKEPDLFSRREKLLKRFENELFETKEVGKTVSRYGRKYTFLRKAKIFKFEGAHMVSDIIDALTKGEFHDILKNWGHGMAYYRRKDSDFKEIFANMYAIHHIPEAMQFMKKHFPLIVDSFEKAMEEFAKTGLITGG